MKVPEIDIPVYTYGKYRAQDGTVENFTADHMRTLVRNTNFVIKSKAFIPTLGYVGYDHPVFGKVKDTDAHGHIVGAKFEDGVVSLRVRPVKDRDGRMRLIEDAKAGRRPHVSGEHSHSFSFVDGGGKTVSVGPTILGLAALGSERPALKNPKITPLSEIEFPEDVSPADAYAARENLRRSGVVAQTFCEGVFAFSEIRIDPHSFADEENEMDEKDIARIVADAVKANDEKWDKRFSDFEKKTADTVKSFSEEGKRKEKILKFCETLNEEKPLGKIALARLEEALINPTEETVRTFAESLPAFIAPGGVAGKAKKTTDADTDEDEDDGDEPKAIAKLRPKHFSDMDANEEMIAAGVKAFGEWKPDALKDAKTTMAKVAVVKAHIVSREAGAN